jgi:hypothetical protein
MTEQNILVLTPDDYCAAKAAGRVTGTAEGVYYYTTETRETFTDTIARANPEVNLDSVYAKLYSAHCPPRLIISVGERID